MEIPVVTQGATLDEVSANLREAVALHLESEDLAELGLAACPSIIVTFELEGSSCLGLGSSTPAENIFRPFLTDCTSV